jgi:hypothetical protein
MFEWKHEVRRCKYESAPDSGDRLVESAEFRLSATEIHIEVRIRWVRLDRSAENSQSSLEIPLSERTLTLAEEPLGPVEQEMPFHACGRNLP